MKVLYNSLYSSKRIVIIIVSGAIVESVFHF